jgi:hypothetical protein
MVKYGLEKRPAPVGPCKDLPRRTGGRDIFSNIRVVPPIEKARAECGATCDVVFHFAGHIPAVGAFISLFDSLATNKSSTETALDFVTGFLPIKYQEAIWIAEQLQPAN